MRCSLSSSAEVDSQVYTSGYLFNRVEEEVSAQDQQVSSPSSVGAVNGDNGNAEASRPVSLHSPVAPFDGAVQEPVDGAIWEPADDAIREPGSGDALESAIEDIQDKYDLGNVIGAGSFAQVRTAMLKDGSGEIRAVKVYQRAPSEEAPGWGNTDLFETEVRMLQLVKSEHIVAMCDFYEDPHFFYIVMEMCRGGEVFTRLAEQKRLSEKTAGLLGKQMLLAIEYLHSLYIVHRDIRAENFMLSGPWITSPLKLIDFGLSCRFEDGVYMTELVGSPHYLAPELIRQRYSHLIDVWSFGVLMFLLLYGHYPFEACSTKEIMVQILSKPIPWHTNTRLSQACLNFLSIVLERFVKKRTTAFECLQQEWIQAPARAGRNETIETSPETIPSALRHPTDTRKQMDPKIIEHGDRKLRGTDASWKKGMHSGWCLGVEEKEGHMDHKERPEFLRRSNKLVSAPSRLQGSKTSEESSNGRSASTVGGNRLVDQKGG